MGLDVSVFKNLVPVYESENGRCLYNVDSFKDRNTLIPEGRYNGERIYHFEMPYSNYNGFRHQLTNVSLGIDPDIIWNDPDTWKDKPFYELIDFSDCEGVIDHLIAENLLKDFIEFRNKANSEMGTFNYETYEEFIEALKLCVLYKGVVVYH